MLKVLWFCKEFHVHNSWFHVSICSPKERKRKSPYPYYILSFLQHPRTWEAQFQSGIKVYEIRMCIPLSFQTGSSSFIWFIIQLCLLQTIALIAVREGVVQLGAVHKVLSLLPFSLNLTHTHKHIKIHVTIVLLTHIMCPFSCVSIMSLKVIEDLSYVVLLRKRFSYIESIPGVLLPHPSSSAYPYKVEGYSTVPEQWHFQGSIAPQTAELYDQLNMPLKITPSMSSLEALLSKLPSVVPPPQTTTATATQPQQPHHHHVLPSQRPLEFMGMQKLAKEELDEEVYRPDLDMGESSSSMQGYHHQQHHFYHHQHQDHNNVTSSGGNNGFWVLLGG